jgi:hypothetical protein
MLNSRRGSCADEARAQAMVADGKGVYEDLPEAVILEV